MRARTVEKIHEASLEVFTRYGYHGATVKLISDAAGLSYGLLYHYFPSKEAIFRSLVDRALDTTRSLFSTALEEPGTPWEKIQHLSATLVREGLTPASSRLFVIMHLATTQCREMPGLLGHIEVHSAALYGQLAPLIVEAQQAGDAVEGDPAALTLAYFSLVQGLMAHQDERVMDLITPDILNNLLRHRG